MKLNRELKFGLWALAAAGVAAVAFFVGATLKPADPPAYVFDVNAPAYDGDVGGLAATSPGGFTGFEDLITEGSRTVLGGQIVELTSDGVTLESPGGSQTLLRLGDESKIERLESGARDLLQPGVEVMIAAGDTDGVAAAVLVLPTP